MLFWRSVHALNSDRETDTQTHTHTQTHTSRHTHTQTNTQTHTLIHVHARTGLAIRCGPAARATEAARKAAHVEFNKTKDKVLSRARRNATNVHAQALKAELGRCSHPCVLTCFARAPRLATTHTHTHTRTHTHVT